MAAEKKKSAKQAAPKKKAPPKKKTAPKKKPAAQKAPGKSTIAQKTAFRKRNRKLIFACWSMALLLAMAAFFEFCLAGYGFSALICAGTAGIIGFYTFVPRIFKKSRTVIRLFTVLLIIGLLIAGVTEALIIRASFGSPETPSDYLLVLGAKVRSDGPSLSLLDRIRGAYDYLSAHPDTIAIVSGGKGGDEPMTEAQCMYDSLVSLGIDPDRIWMEDKATSTWENLQFSLALIEEKTGHRPEKLAILSSEYHLFRASLFARAAGVECIGVPARTSYISLKINYFLREIAGVWHYILLGGNYHA